MSMSDYGGVLFFFLVLVALMFLFNRWGTKYEERKDRPRIEAWAAARGLQLLSMARGLQLLFAKQRTSRSPFWMITRGQRVYHVIVADQQGKRRTGWLCMGRPIMSRKDMIEVAWDDGVWQRFVI